MRQQPGIWNGIWSDMFIESTFMRYGHGAGGIVGLTLQPAALKKWAHSLHICGQLTKDVPEMADVNTNKIVRVHKEEMPARMTSDAEDRQKLRSSIISRNWPCSS